MELRNARIRGIYSNDGCRIWVNDTEITPERSQKIYNHSCEFNWGYMGSGPAQTALAICYHVFRSERRAVDLHQLFKANHVSTWPQGRDFSVVVDFEQVLDLP